MDNIINITPNSPKLNVTDTNDEGVIKLNITPMDDNTQKSVIITISPKDHLSILIQK